MKIRKNKKVVNLTESDLRRIVKRVISEEEEMGIEMMDVSSDSDYYKSRKRDVSIPKDDLDILISRASRFCRNQMPEERLEYMTGSELEEKSRNNECYRVELLNREYGRWKE